MIIPNKTTMINFAELVGFGHSLLSHILPFLIILSTAYYIHTWYTQAIRIAVESFRPRDTH